MAQFFTLSFELIASAGKTEKIVDQVKSYLTNQGATDILFTHSGDPEDEDEEPEPRLSRRIR